MYSKEINICICTVQARAFRLPVVFPRVFHSECLTKCVAWRVSL